MPPVAEARFDRVPVDGPSVFVANSFAATGVLGLALPASFAAIAPAAGGQDCAPPDAEAAANAFLSWSGQPGTADPSRSACTLPPAPSAPPR